MPTLVYLDNFLVIPVPGQRLHADSCDDAAKAAESLHENDVSPGPAGTQGSREARGTPANHQHLAPGLQYLVSKPLYTKITFIMCI